MRTDAAAVTRRVYGLMLALSGAGVSGAWFLGGMPAVAGFLAGAALAFANAWWMHRLSMSVGVEGRRTGASSLFAVLRYLVMLIVLYGILKVSEPGFLAALAGCFIHIVAVILEVIFELTYGTS